MSSLLEAHSENAPFRKMIPPNQAVAPSPDLFLGLRLLLFARSLSLFTFTLRCCSTTRTHRDSSMVRLDLAETEWCENCRKNTFHRTEHERVRGPGVFYKQRVVSESTIWQAPKDLD